MAPRHWGTQDTLARAAGWTTHSHTGCEKAGFRICQRREDNLAWGSPDPAMMTPKRFCAHLSNRFYISKLIQDLALPHFQLYFLILPFSIPFFKKKCIYLHFIWKTGTVGKKNKKTPIPWFAPKIPITASTGPGWSWKPQFQSRGQIPKYLYPHRLPSGVCKSRKLDWNAGGTLIWDGGIPRGNKDASPNTWPILWLNFHWWMPCTHVGDPSKCLLI